MRNNSVLSLSVKLIILSLFMSLCACQPDNNTSNVNLGINAKLTLTDSEFTNLLTATVDHAAHWLNPQTLLIAPQYKTVKKSYLINFDSKNQQANLLTTIELEHHKTTASPQSTDELNNIAPHLQHFFPIKTALTEPEAKTWLKNGIALLHVHHDGAKTLSLVQTAKIIDYLYTRHDNDADEEKDLGATITFINPELHRVYFKLWAPTAKNVEALLYLPDPNQTGEKKIKGTVKLQQDGHTGVWLGDVVGNYHLGYYQYRIEIYHPDTQQTEQIITTDPYSLSLSTNSEYSQIIDLSTPITQPENWLQQQDVKVKNPEDAIIYETHIRDFSGREKRLSNQAYRGKYKAFSEQHSYGIEHLKALQSAGLNHIHLLPTFDLGTINEDVTQRIALTDSIDKVCQLMPSAQICTDEIDKQQSLDALLSRFDASSDKAQAVVSELREIDDYNWGYDPFHYTVPEGSYAVNPEGHYRIIEFREMIQSLHNLGFRVIMDVVYNHTHKAGLATTSVLDKIVPNYYQRLHPTSGEIEQSTCCDNTATEHAMMEKLMIDSLVTWAKDYKIDGFRFDLMGHQPKAAMLKARAAVRAVDPDTYFYGEGWNFGEVANNSQFVQASQRELAGTEIGTFTDRLRDAVRGSSYNVTGFAHRKNQGLGNGLGTFNNEMQNPNDLHDYYQKMAQLRIGLAGNLANIIIEDQHGNKISGKQVLYGGEPAGYALDPADTINYVSKHDNQTLWDNSQYRLPFSATKEQRVRLHNQSLSYALLAQGIPFLHMGSELMRSKSFLRDSYDYSDWFNAVDYSKASNNYHVGLPPAEKDQANWPLITSLLANNQGRDMVTQPDIEFTAEVFKNFIALRASSPLFRLTSAEQIIDKVRFLNTGKAHQLGLIAMLIDDNQGKPVDNQYQQILVIFNHNPEAQNFRHQDLTGFTLHPIQQTGIDEITKTSKIINDKQLPAAVIPAFTTAVFVKTKKPA